MKKIVAALATSVLLASAANAVVIVSSTHGPDTGLIIPPEMLITNFNTAAGLSGTYSLVTGTVKNKYAAPLGDTSQYLAVLGGESATLSLAKPYKELSVYLGSIDKYNTISFFDGTTKVASFTGDQIPFAPADGSQGSVLNNRRVTFAFGTDKVTSVMFSSGANSFELDTIGGISSTVPEPKTWALLLVGFGMVGLSARRRRQTKVLSA